MNELPTSYTSLGASEKLALLWERVQSDVYPGEALPSQVPSDWARRRLFSVPYDRVSFEHCSDELPPGRVKLVHRHGSVAPVRLEVDPNSPLTGVLGSGARGLIRFSDASGGKKLTPSVALKFPIDGKASLNFFALPTSPREPGNRDFFATPLSNAATPPQRLDEKFLASRFEKTAKVLKGSRLHAGYLPLHELAKSCVTGDEVAQERVPDRLELYATEEARAARDDEDWRHGLARLTPGTSLYRVEFAMSMEAPTEPLGEIVLESAPVSSRYGDERLFFQHHVGPRD